MHSGVGWRSQVIGKLGPVCCGPLHICATGCFHVTPDCGRISDGIVRAQARLDLRQRDDSRPAVEECTGGNIHVNTLHGCSGLGKESDVEAWHWIGSEAVNEMLPQVHCWVKEEGAFTGRTRIAE